MTDIKFLGKTLSGVEKIMAMDTDGNATEFWGGDPYAARKMVNGTITEYIDKEVTKIRSNAFSYCDSLTTVICHNVTTVSAFLNTGQSESSISPLVSLAFPKITAMANYGFQNNKRMGKLDLTACTTLGSNRSFENCYWFTVLVLRNTNVVTLGATNVLGNTPFTGRGGRTADLYVPSDLIDDYQAATNWSTILGNGYVTIHAIEGSEYETHYVDGTEVGS